jgi:hypothetical protein
MLSMNTDETQRRCRVMYRFEVLLANGLYVGMAMRTPIISTVERRRLDSVCEFAAADSNKKRL